MELIKITKFSLKGKIIIFFIFFLIFIFFIFFFCICPSVKKIKEIRKEINVQRIDLEKKYLKGQNFKKVFEKLKKIDEKIKMLDKVFINKNDSLKFVTTIEDVAEKNNITQKINLASFNQIEGNYYKEIPLQFFSQGSFSDQIKYLIDLESLDYYINIESIDITSSQQGKNNFNNLDLELKENNVNIMILANTYWKP